MQTENFAPEKQQEQILKQIEKRDMPPAELAKEMLRQGDKKITELKSQIDDLIGEMEWEADQETTVTQLKMLSASLDQAYREMQADLRVAQQQPELPDEAGWDIEGASASAEAETEINIAIFNDTVDGLMSGANFDFETFQEIRQQAERSKEAAAALKEGLENSVGKKYTRLLMENPEYAESLERLSVSLEGKLDGDGPEILAEHSLENLIAVHEMFGDGARELVNALDLKRYENGLRHARTENVIQIASRSLDQDSGEYTDLEIDMGMGMEYDFEATDESTGEKSIQTADAEIYRKFSRTLERQPDGTLKGKKKVHHELLRIPEALQGNSMAARVTKECLAHYDASAIDEITLNASLERGGYTWAAYGYGWDEGPMALTSLKEDASTKAVENFDEAGFIRQLANSEPGLDKRAIMQRVDATKQNLRNNASREAVRSFSEMDTSKRQEYLLKKIDKLVASSISAFQAAAQEAGIQPESIGGIMAEYEEMRIHPETVTPQKLAAIGRDGPLLRIGESGVWRTEEDFRQAVAQGEDKEIPQMKGAFHAGKIALSGTSWYGKIELKPQGGQQGVNRKTLEKVLDKSIKKYEDRKQQTA